MEVEVILVNGMVFKGDITEVEINTVNDMLFCKVDGRGLSPIKEIRVYRNETPNESHP